MKISSTFNLNTRWVTKSELDEKQLETLETIYGLYESSLELNNHSRIPFTPHGVSHCKNIFDIITNIFDSYFDYDNLVSFPLNKEEVFCLLTSILLHDYAFVQYPEKRKLHASIIAKEIENLIGKDHTIGSLITGELLLAITRIVEAHSDGDNEEFQKIVEMEGELIRGFDCEIDIQLLSALLRLADELDVCFKRIGKVKYKSLYDFEEKSIERDSYKHWRVCDLFLLPEINKDNLTEILFKVRDDKIIYSGVKDIQFKKSEDAEIIKTSFEKINYAISKLNEIVFNKRTFTWRLLQASNNHESSKPNSNSNIVQFSNSSVNLVDDVLNKKISKYVLDKKLLNAKHVRIGANICVKDWIDIDSIFNDTNLLNIITDVMISLYKERYDGCKIVGVGYRGGILASIVATYCGVPFSYLVASNDRESSSEHERRLVLNENENVVLITDVLVTGNSIVNAQEVVNNCNIETSVNACFTIFYRDSGKDGNCIGNLDFPIHTINSVFPADICKDSDNCPYNGKLCSSN